MKIILCRHRQEFMFEKLGFGIVIADFERHAEISWVLHKKKHSIAKNYLFFLNEKESVAGDKIC